MSRFLATSRRLAFGVAAIALVASWTASGARADMAYAYAEETISNLTPDAGITVTGSSALSQTSANLTGFAPKAITTNTFDAPQSLLGPGPGENSFVKFATFAHTPALAGDLPITPTSSFARGDVLLVGNSGMAVSESYAKGTGIIGGGDGNNHITFTFTATAGTHSISFNYANDLYAVVNNPADQANGTFSFSVRLTGGGINQFLTVPPETSIGTLGAPPNQNETILTGNGTVTTPALVAGTTYTVVFSLDANTNVSTAVPEPATMAMALTALPLLGLGLLRRRNRKAQA